MPQVETEPVVFERRRDWTKDEWIVAFDACPKDRQRYSSSSRDVLEVAFLLNRTPAAVSRAFANLWAAMTGGREGLANYATTCGMVVEEYRGDLGRLHRDALAIRSRFVRDSLAPRLEVRIDGGTPVLGTDLRLLGTQAAQETGVPRKLFVLYRRSGSLVEGAVLVLFGALARPIGERFVRWVESRLRRRPASGTLEVIRNQTWVDLREGRRYKVEERIILHYLPSTRVQSLDAKTRNALASFLTPILGVARASATGRDSPSAPTPARVSEIEERLGFRVGQLSAAAIAELDALLRVADTQGLRNAAKKLEQTRLEDFERG